MKDKKSFKKEKFLNWLFFGTSSLIILLTVVLGTRNSLYQAGINIGSGEVMFVMSISLVFVVFCITLKNLWFPKINAYFIAAVVLSWIILYIGLSFFSNMYATEIPLNVPYSPIIGGESDLRSINGNGTIEISFYPMECHSISKKRYFSQLDVLLCNITTDLGNSSYKLDGVDINKGLINRSNTPDIQGCYGNNSCLFPLYLEDNSLNFFIYPVYRSEDLIPKKPVFYYFNVAKLRNWKDLESLEQNRVTLLTAIITAALLTVWAGIYYAKQLLKKDG